MNQRACPTHVASTEVFRDTCGLQSACRTASTIKNRWRSGEPPDLAAVLENQPELKQYRTVVLDLAYEEYRLRQQAGESLDADAFAQRFPWLQRSLCLFIAVHSLLESQPDFSRQFSALCWPEAESQFLGFELIGEIGRGAFGRVFLARELALGQRQVVLKVALHGGDEAEILGRLRHPNIVPIYSIQEDDETGMTGFCMPFLGRATLASVLDEVHADHRPPVYARALLDAVEASNQGVEALDVPQPDRILRSGWYVEGVIHLGVQLAEALAHAHARGIFHRDLKPSNILMSPEGRPLLLDFNLSVDDRHPAWRIGGTLPYMAPEELGKICDPQVSKGVRYYDPHSDLFSLGVILYELLSGSLPFGPVVCAGPIGEVAEQLRQRQLQGPLPIRERNGQVDKRLARLIESCLAADPELRPRDAAHLATALRSELAPTRRLSRWLIGHRRPVLVAVSILAALALGVAAFLAFRPSYSVRQLQQGRAYFEARQDALAVGSLNAAILADPRSDEALLLRARAHQRLGDFRMAFEDYQAAGRLAPSPMIDACKGYCLSQLGQHTQAVAFYERSLQSDYASPAVLNDLGFTCIQLGRLDDAESALRRAVQADDRLQVAHHNLALVFLRRAIRGQAVPADAFAHVARAVELGPESAELYRDLAALHAIAVRQDSAYQQVAVQYAGRAVALGMDPEAFKSDPVFSDLQKDPALQQALAKSDNVRKLVKAAHLVDPSGDKWPAVR